KGSAGNALARLRMRVRAEAPDRPAVHQALQLRVEMHRQIVEVDRMHLIVATVGPPLDRELVPYLLAQLHRAVRAVHAQKRNATQDEWHDGGIELRVRREADRRDATADFHGRQQPREQVAAETVDRARKDRLVERTDLGEVDRLPQANLLRAEAAQISA